MDDWKMYTFLFGARPIFRGENVRSRECIWKPCWYIHLQWPGADFHSVGPDVLHVQTINQFRNLEPQTPIYKWLFQLDDSKSLYRKWLFHQTSISKWLFGVPGNGKGLMDNIPNTTCRPEAVQCAEYPIFVSPATTVWLSWPDPWLFFGRRISTQGIGGSSFHVYLWKT